MKSTPAIEVDTKVTAGRRGLSIVWAILPLLLGIPAAFTFWWAAHRLHSRALGTEAACYGCATILALTLAGQRGGLGTVGGGLSLALVAVATTRAFVIRDRVFFPVAQPVELASPPPTRPDWKPKFPASGTEPSDSSTPATWVTPFTCTAHDSHLLTMPITRTASAFVSGLVLVAVDIRFHVNSRGVGLAIGLMLTPLITAMFSQRVDGSTLYYRRWGVRHALSLFDVTAVGTSSAAVGSATLTLTAPGLSRPLRVALRLRGFVVPTAAREHLQGWLDRPGVQFSPPALALLRTGTLPSTGAPLRRRQQRLLVALWVLGPVLGLGVGAWLLFGVTETRSPRELIVGKAITLPPALFEANRPGSPSLITPFQAHIVAETMWGLREKVLVESDTRALSQLMSPGPTLAGTINYCAYPGGKCVEETSPRTFSQMQAIVPLQRSYPIYFLAAFRTRAYVSVSATSDLESWQPWIELQILTKASPTAPWQLSFDTGYNAVGGGPPPLLPFDLQNVAIGRSGFAEPYNVKPRAPAPVSVSRFLPLLANYYQSFKDVGHAPKVSWFITGGYANGVGQGLLIGRQGSVYGGDRENFYFSGDASAGSWEFSAGGGYPMICGSVLDTSTDTAIFGYLNQNADETNYGVPLPPGEYRKITSLVEHETCVFVVQDRLDNAGDNLYASAVTGQRNISGP